MTTYEPGTPVTLHNPASMFHGDSGRIVEHRQNTNTGEWLIVDFGQPRENRVPCRPSELVLNKKAKG